MIGAKSALWVRITIICLSALLVSAQPGFLSIDCGSTVNYTDKVTGIEWTTDDGYIETGQNTAVVSKEGGSLDNLTQVWDNRFFPERKKNCYILPAEYLSTYLIRATFKFLDRGQIVNDLRFQVYVNSTPWTPLIYTSAPGSGGLSLDSTRVFEAIVNSTGEEIHVCLVRVQGDPFISSLELRLLDKTMYSRDDTGLAIGKMLFLEYRWNLGALPGPGLRYPDDEYDRIWYPYVDIGKPLCPTTLNTSKPVIPQNSGNRVPPMVMQDACVGAPNISFIITFPTTVQVFYGILYFQEIDDNATESNKRGIQIDVNVQQGFLPGNPDPAFLNVTRTLNETFSASFNLSNFVFSTTLSKTPESRLNPLANAAEYYIMNDVNTSVTDSNDTRAVERVKAGFNLIGYTGDPCYPASWDWVVCNYSAAPARITQLTASRFSIKGVLDPAVAALTQLTILFADNNELTGEIPDLRGLTKLERVHLQVNNLTGLFPEYLFLSQSLVELDVSSNNLSGRISSCPGPKLQLLCDGNPDFSCSEELQACIDSGNGKSQVATITGGAVAGFVVLSLIVVCLVFLILAKRKRARKREAALRQLSEATRTKLIPRGLPSNFSSDSKVNSACFTLEQIKKMTNNYLQKIGQGSYGAVYLGELPSGKKVAVKVHDAMSRQGIDEFMNEVNLLSRVHHRNLVSLLGYCEEYEEQILVYEYMGNGTLREHLYAATMDTDPLGWKTRLDIAIDSGKGLEYLHKDCHPQIIHRDVKSSNILLDEKFVAKVADFGLSKAGPDAGFNSGVSTVVKGTPGYFDPEYFMTQRLTHKSDVYSFGIVLLELISGIPPFNSRLPDGSSGTLVEWVQKQLQENTLAIADEKLKGQYNDDVMTKVIELAVSCIALQSVTRPDMEQIVRVLCEARESEFPVEQVKGLSPTSPAPLALLFSDSASSSLTITDSSGTPTQAVSKIFPSYKYTDSPSMDASYQVGR